eukprot:TRINITY_DN369_c0_g1_i13.p1 TRINITY_DN369_c0_g1~~TRINITY_DN369_c0_g1_i13.p1  ORF type:complete len:118 (-),score=12.48 TRINITY_DN369_c0_g1_i13:48-401(-)
MTYLEAAIKEASRLCPVASGLLRESEEDVTVDNIKFRKGTSILINTYAYNRSEDVFGPTANEFRPERWAEKNTPTTSFKQGYGLRSCFGRRYALLTLNVPSKSLMSSDFVQKMMSIS